MVYNGDMEFIETPVFTKWITQTISDDSYQELQKLLVVAEQIFMLFAFSKKELEVVHEGLCLWIFSKAFVF